MIGISGNGFRVSGRGLTAAAFIGFIVVLAISSVTPALEPPTPEQIRQYKEDGTLKERIAFAGELGNHRTSPRLVWDAHNRLYKLVTGKDSPDAMTPPPCWQGGLPSTGNPKVLVLLIAFADMPPVSGDTQSLISSKLFGDGTEGLPYDSLRNFYRRSSYNQLDIGGSALGWYTTSYNRSGVLQTTTGRQNLIKEVINYYNSQGHDFSQYDNDGDGTVDYFAVIWTGAHGAWASFWWGYQTSFTDGSYTVDGKHLGAYSWQWESYGYPSGLFEPSTIIHETGHALGLPDYYDYDSSIGPDGGVGGLDQMDWYGDHCCFSKFLLNWITPTVCGSSGAHQVSMQPSESSRDAMIVMPGATGSSFEEYFMVQVRNQTQNDIDYPSKGLLIWHVDARLSAGNCDYEYDNSYSDHKLLRLMEADGLEEIEQGYSADAGDYYVTGRSFGDSTTPNSRKYDGTTTGVAVNNISAYADPMTFNLSCMNCPTITVLPSSLPNGVAGTAYSQTITASGGTAPYTYAVTSGALPGGLTLSPAGLLSGTPSNTGNYNFTVTATDSGSCAGSRNYTLSVCSSEVPADVAASNNRCGDVQVTWSPVSGATSYNVYRGTVCGTPLNTFTGVSSPFNDTSAVGGTAYYYWVAAVSSCGTSGNSACAPGSRLLNPTPAISGGNANICPSSTVLLSTTPGKSNYQWYRNGTAVSGATANQHSASMTGNYTVSYTDANGCSGTSASHGVTITACIPNIVFLSRGAFSELTGDGDNWIEKGEKWSVPVTVINSGNTPATSVSAFLSGNEIVVCNNPGTFATLAAGSSAAYDFEFVVSDSFSQCGGAIGFDLTGKSCVEQTPAGADESDLFTAIVGQQIAGSPTNLLIQPSSADSYVNQSVPAANYGSEAAVYARSRVSQAERALVEFDLSSVPAGSIINSATLELYATTVSGGSLTLDVHKVTGTWTESGVTWNNMPAFGSAAEASVAAGTSAGWKIWDVSSAVQDWVDGPASNYGFIVKGNTENAKSAITYALASKEDGTPTRRPILRINFTPPISWDCGYTGSGICSAIPGEVAPGDTYENGQMWSGDKETQSWPPLSGAATYKVHRGVRSGLENLLTTSDDSCLRYEGPSNSLSVVSDDPSTEPGSFYWYLVVGGNGSGEGSAGSATGGPRVVNSSGSCF
ncbi:MAG TPA: M6 family metalloprotease domain-containing protein [Acidobacteriota bacterium]|nr:M6 family metalloprotease domain-containing protein [Acidobacteriota bacterium]